MKATARNCALEALLQVEENSGYSNIVLDKTLRKANLEKRDSALCSHIFYGVLEKRITLDFYISKFLTKPAFTLNNAIREILRIAFYQALFLDKIPDSAIVNEAVNCAREIKKEALTGFINGVLREFFRKKDSIMLPSSNSDEDLSIQYSVPEPLIEMWKNQYGEKNAIEILESFSLKSRNYIRINSKKVQTLDLGEKYHHLNFAYELPLVGDLTQLDEFKQGLFHVQDLSSQYLCEILSPKVGETVVDVCSAPGGKTFTISQEVGESGKVYAYDLYKGRVKLIREGAYRLGLTNVLASMRDATCEKYELENADKVLCDVPCSGFGTIRRKPEIRYKDLSDLNDLPTIQYDILKKSAKFLKKGGVLIYSTCTLNKKENGDIADKFLSENSDFEPVSVIIPKGIKKVVLEPENQLTIMPYASDGDGFFVAMFRKK